MGACWQHGEGLVERSTSGWQGTGIHQDLGRLLVLLVEDIEANRLPVFVLFVWPSCCSIYFLSRLCSRLCIVQFLTYYAKFVCLRIMLCPHHLVYTKYCIHDVGCQPQRRPHIANGCDPWYFWFLGHAALTVLAGKRPSLTIAFGCFMHQAFDWQTN